MVKDHSDNELGNPLPLFHVLFSISRKIYLYMHHVSVPRPLLHKS